MARNWKGFWSRFGKEANSASGVAGIAGLGLGVIGGIAAAPVVIGVGGTCTVMVAAYCAYRAIPSKARRPNEMAGSVIFDLAELANIDPPLKRVGVLGPSRVGKTTLLTHLQMRLPTNERTETPYACVVAIPNTDTYVAIVDAAGQQYSQQFKVFDEADAIIVLFDHNESDVDSGIVESRINRHKSSLIKCLGTARTRERFLH